MGSIDRISPGATDWDWTAPGHAVRSPNINVAAVWLKPRQRPQLPLAGPPGARAKTELETVARDSGVGPHMFWGPSRLDLGALWPLLWTHAAIDSRRRTIIRFSTRSWRRLLLLRNTPHVHMLQYTYPHLFACCVGFNPTDAYTYTDRQTQQPFRASAPSSASSFSQAPSPPYSGAASSPPPSASFPRSSRSSPASHPAPRLRPPRTSRP